MILRTLLLLAVVLLVLQQSLHAAPAVSAGFDHSLILRADGTVWACGSNLHGQLGDGTITNRSIPVRVMSGVQAISAGVNHSLFLKTDGTVWGCGENYYGALGDRRGGYLSTPSQIISGVKAIAAGGGFSLFLKTDGTVWACGNNTYGQNGGYWVYNYDQFTPSQVQTGVQALAAGTRHSLFLKTNGAFNYHGPGTYVEEDWLTVNTPRNPGVTLEQGNVQSISAGYDRSFFLTDGRPYVWFTRIRSERDRRAIELSGIKAISGGFGADTLFLKTDGTAWHGNFFTPYQVAISGVQAISEGGHHSLFLKADGTFWGSGDNSDGQLGNGGFSFMRPTQVFKILAGASTRLIGQVLVMRDGQRIPHALGDSVYEDDVVITGPKSFIKMDFNDNSQINLGQNSEMKIVKIIPKELSIIDLVKGWVRSQVTKDFSGTIKQQIRTRQGSMGVRGTEFEVSYSEANGVATSRLDVFEGLVDMTDYATQETFGVGANMSRTLRTAVPPLPLITLQPADGALVEGQTLEFSAAAAGALSYQWSRDGEDIDGATAANYVIGSALLSDTGAYTCTVIYADNRYGPYVSDPGWARVYPETNLVIRNQPLNQTTFVGESAYFCSVATSAKPVAYQWRRDGAPIAGATASTYSIENLQTSDAGIYTCTVSDADEQVVSSEALLTVDVPANSPPVALGKTISIKMGESKIIRLEGTDAEASALKYKIIKRPKKGRITGKAPMLIYKPNSGATGFDSFTFQVNDGNLDSATATVSIKIKRRMR